MDDKKVKGFTAKGKWSDVRAELQKHSGKTAGDVARMARVASAWSTMLRKDVIHEPCR